MKFFDSLHECANADGVWASRGGIAAAWIAHKLFSAVIHGIVLSNLVGKADALEEDPDFLSGVWQLEIILANAELGEGWREQKVYGFRLVSVVLLFNRLVCIKKKV